MSDKLLIATVGLPRSGKSTWARSTPHPIVCPDAIRLAFHGQRFIGECEQWIWVFARTMVQALFMAGHDVVILDSTMMLRKRRDEWKSPRWLTVWKVIETPREECLRRARLLGDDEIVPIIERMAAQWEPLGEDEQAFARV